MVTFWLRRRYQGAQNRYLTFEFWLARRFGRIWALDYRCSGLTLALARMGCQSIYWKFSGNTETFRPAFSGRPLLTLFLYWCARRDKSGHWQEVVLLP